MSNTLTLNNPLSESDWNKIFDVELEKTEHIWFKTPSGKRVDFIRGDVLDKIRAEIENHCGLTKENHCRYCSYCNILMGVREILEIIDKYKAEQGVSNASSD